MHLTITEIISRSDQGVTRPFLCRAEDDQLYYVKGRYAGFRALSGEWVAGGLGKLLRLPIPNFCIAAVPATLIGDSSRTDAAELGNGLVFASQLVDDAQEIAFSDVDSIALDLKQKVLLFDWWIRNEDRTLTEFGGNPNLLRTAGGELRVFDLNLAFDETFDEARFWQSHVFNRAVASWPDEFKVEMIGQMQLAINELPAIWAELPVEWQQASGLDSQAVQQLLKRFETSPDDFWVIRR